MRQVSRSRLVSELSPQDRRVKLCGVVIEVSKEEGRLVLDDGTGTTNVLLNNLDLIERLDSYRQGDQLMVIGWANPQGVDGEVIRRIEGFDPSRYKQVLEVWKDVRGKDEQA